MPGLLVRVKERRKCIKCVSERARRRERLYVKACAYEKNNVCTRDRVCVCVCLRNNSIVRI